MEQMRPKQPTSWKWLSSEEALAQMSTGAVRAIDLAHTTLRLVEQCQQRLNAFSVIASQEANQAAVESDRRYRDGNPRPLEGLPIGVKDVIDTKGIETRYGSAAYLENFPSDDAEVVKLLRDAGAVIIGKTTTHEFAWGVTTSSSAFGDTLHPQNRLRIPGGSSGGAAVAVADGAIAASLGTDTGGSVRIPAALCGTVGFKPTYGSISTAGIFPLAPSLDHPGVVATSVADASLVARALGVAPAPMPASPRLGVVWEIPPVPLDHEVSAAFSQAVNSLRQSFAIADAKSSNVFDGSFSTFATIVLAEAAIGHFARNSQATIIHRYGAETVERIERSRSLTIGEYATAQTARAGLAVAISHMMEEFDFLVLPTCACLAPMVGQNDISIRGWRGSIREALMTYTAPFNLSGQPSISIPIGRRGQLPIGLQIVGRRGDDGRLLSLAQKVADILSPPAERSRKFQGRATA